MELLFKQYLNHNLALGAFIENIRNDPDNSMDQHFKTRSPSHYVSYAFAWAETPEGREFWLHHSVQWESWVDYGRWNNE